MYNETRLQYLTKDEAAALVSAKPIAVLPVGSTEQHGPTGLCGTDAICVTEIAKRGAALAGVLVLPTIAYTPAQFNMGFPGTISIQSRTLAAIFLDIFVSVTAQQIKRLIILNGHGANRAAIDVAMHDFYAQLGDAACRIETVAWWELGEVPVLRREIFGAGEGLHATPSEISITQALYRQVATDQDIRPKPLAQEMIAKLSGDRHGPANEHAKTYPDGLVGSDPGLASPELGELLLTKAGDGLAVLLNRE